MNPHDLKLGAHMSIAGGHANAVLAAHSAGCRSVQLFTKNNNQWRAPELSAEGIKAFREALATYGIVDPVAHTSYLINPASPDETLWNRSIDAIVVEIERSAALGIRELVTHPGAAMGEPREKALKRVVKGLNLAFKRTRGLDVRVDLETTAGQGSSLGSRFDDLALILGSAKTPERLGVCLDSCHLFAAGYPLGDPEGYNQTMEALDDAVGLGTVRVWHLNDSKREFGARVDRHAGIGMGLMGLEPFRNILNDPRFADLPMILETPKGLTESGEDNDVRNLRTLRDLVSVSPSRKSRQSRRSGAHG